jgi:hypothetical protein
VLDLGIQPLANNLLRTEDNKAAEPRFPLRMAVCQSCWLMQILDIIPPVTLFSEYLYFSSFSPTLLAHARNAAERYIHEFNLGEDSLVIEVASNDGYLLENFVKAKVPCIGIEPAANIAKVSREKGIETLVDFFGPELAAQLVSANRKADLLLGNNVFAHVPDINGFARAVKLLLKPGGTAVFEVPYGLDLIDHTEFDTIYHEHVFYFVLTPLIPLFAKHGLEVWTVERIPIHGGSIRVFVSQTGSFKVEDSVRQMIEAEEQQGVARLEYYEAFQTRVLGLKKAMLSFLDQQKREGKRIAAYGASAKGSTLLNFYGLTGATLDFVVDRSHYKQGRLTPGTHLSIRRPDALLDEMPDYTLLLTWNFAGEILEQQQEYRRRGGKFVTPIPNVKVL